MRFIWPKSLKHKSLRPLGGWRAYWGEVGIVVLGVLLALVAQQIVEDARMRSEVREFRRTLDHEIGLNLYAYDVRTRSSACNMRRIRELLKWLREADDGRPLPKLSLYNPPAIYLYRSAWDSRDGTVFSYIPAAERQKYAEFYDELAGNNRRLEEERDAWDAMKGYELPGAMTTDDRRIVYRQLARAFTVDAMLMTNIPVSTKIADGLGIRPIQPDGLPPELHDALRSCESIFVPGVPATP